MRKWLLIFVGVSVLVVTVVLVTCNYQRAREEEKRTSTESPPPPASIQPENSKSAKQACDCTPKTPCWYILLAWPEGITAWAIILTFAVIGWQADETRKAAQAARDSILIQEAEFLQWVDIGEWTVQPDGLVDWARQGDEIIRKPEQIEVRIGFHLLNNSTRPLSICSVRTVLEIGPDMPVTSYLVEEEKQTPPKGEYGVVIDTVFAGAQVFGYILDRLPIVVTVHVDFINALRKPGHAEFERLVMCGVTVETTSIGRGHVSNEIKTGNAKTKEQEQSKRSAN